MDRKQRKVLSKSFVANQSLNSSSFTKLPDGSMKRKRQKASYKDIYLEKQNFIPTQMPLSKHRNGNYSTLYHNNIIINMSHDNSNYSFKTEDNEDNIAKKASKHAKKNSSGSFSQQKLTKAKNLNINTSNSIYPATTTKKEPKNLKATLGIESGGLSVKNQIKAGINLLNISNRSQNTSRSIQYNSNNNNEIEIEDKPAETLNIDEDNENMNILQSLAVQTFKENQKKHSHSFTCPKTISDNDIMVEFLSEKANEDWQMKRKMRKSFEMEGISIRNTYVCFGGIHGLNGLFESSELKREFGMIDTFNPSKFKSKRIKQGKCDNKPIDNFISGSLIEKEEDFEQFQAITNTLCEAISKQDSLKENNSKKEDGIEKEQEGFNSSQKRDIDKIDESFGNDDGKEECIVIKGDQLLTKKDIVDNKQVNELLDKIKEFKEQLYEGDDQSIEKEKVADTKEAKDEESMKQNTFTPHKHEDFKKENKEEDSNQLHNEGHNENEEEQLKTTKREQEEEDINHPRLIDISPDKKHYQEETNSSFNKEAETEYNNPESTTSKNTPTDQDKHKQETKPFEEETQETHKSISNKIIFNAKSKENQSYQNPISQLKQGSPPNKSSDRYEEDESQLDNSKEDTRTMQENKDNVEKQIEEINRINESLKAIQETIEKNQIEMNQASHSDPNKERINEEDEEEDSFEKSKALQPKAKEDTHSITSLISEFKRNSLSLKEEQQQDIKGKINKEVGDQCNILRVSEERNDDFIIVENAILENTSGHLANSKLSSNDMLLSRSQNEDNREEGLREKRLQEGQEEGEERSANRLLLSKQSEQKDPISQSQDRLTTEQRDEENNMEISLSISQSDHYNENLNENELNDDKDNGFYPSPEKISHSKPNQLLGELDKYPSPNKSTPLGKGHAMRNEIPLINSPNEQGKCKEDLFKAGRPQRGYDEEDQERDNEMANEEDQNYNYYYKDRDEIQEVDEDCEESFKKSVGTNLFNTQPNASGDKMKRELTEEKEEMEKMNCKIKALLGDFYSEEKKTSSNGNNNTPEEKIDGHALKLQRLNNMKNMLSKPQQGPQSKDDFNHIDKQGEELSPHHIENKPNQMIKQNKESPQQIQQPSNVINSNKEVIKSVKEKIDDQTQKTSDDTVCLKPEKEIPSFEISNIRIAIGDDSKSQPILKTPSTITFTKEESFNVAGKSPSQIPIEVKQFSIENLSFNFNHLPPRLDPSSKPNQQETLTPKDKPKDSELPTNNEEEYKIFTSNKLSQLQSGANAKTIESPKDNAVNTQIDNFINQLKVKNKSKESSLATIMTQKENELKYLKEKQEFISKQKQINQGKRTIDIVNYEDKAIDSNNYQSNERNEPRLSKLLNKAPVVYDNINDNTNLKQNPLGLMMKNSDDSSQKQEVKNATIVEEIIQKKKALYAKSHKSIFQNEPNSSNANCYPPSTKAPLHSEQKVNLNDLMILGDDGKHNKVGSFFDFEGFTSNSKRDREKEGNKEKKLIEKSIYLNKVKEDRALTEKTKRGKEENNKFNQSAQPNRNKYMPPNNFIMPANSLEDVLETKDIFFFGK